MTKDFLAGLGLTEEQIAKVQAESGKDIEREKAKFADYDDAKKRLDEANAKIAELGEAIEKGKADKAALDGATAEIAKYKAEAEKAKAESEAQIAKMKREAQVKDFTGGKKFVNEITRNAVNAQIAEKLSGDEAKGKSIEDIFKEIVGDGQDILVDENSPQLPQTPPRGNQTDADDAKVREIMGLPPKK